MPTLIAVGDVGPNRPDPRRCFDLSRDLLREGDLTFGQLECNLTDRGARLPQVRHTHRSTPQAAVAMREAGFDVISYAGNHCMDWGADAFFDTIEALEAAELSVVGVGKDIAAARVPVIREVNGVRVAFIAASSILPMGFWAEAKRPGCVPMRAHTLYEQVEHDQPGTPARVHSFAHREDMAALVADVKAARAQADVVIVSLHWGIHFVPATIADYQREVGHAVIDAGADMILGHHAHILKGIEVYRGKPIFYSVGNFAIDLPMTPEHAQGKGFKEIQALSPGWEPDFDSLYNFPPDSRMTMFVRAELGRDGLGAVGFHPAFINSDAQPAPMPPEDERFAKVTDYVRWCSEEAGLAVRLDVDGGLVRVLPA
jgi:hypothetical protein